MDQSPSLYESSVPQVSVALRHDDAYVLSLANLPTAYAASASSPSNKIDLIDKRSLRRIQTLPGHDVATTSIRAVDCVTGMPGRTLLSTGKDGSVKVWDDRSGSHSIKLTNMGNTSLGILSCDVSPDGNLVAAGTEFLSQDAFILYWDPRQPAAPLRTHSSTHSDDITTMSFYPSASSPPLILSGSSDGLLSISDANEDDEDEAVVHVGSWGPSISQAGWYLPSPTSTSLGVWAASDMETFSLWSNELDQRLSLDIRSPSVHSQSRTWVTDYLISCFPSNNWGLRVYTGSNEGDVALITPPDLSSPDPSMNGAGKWTLHSLWTKNHVGVVRSILPDDDNGVIITGGEDGNIHLWNNENPFPSTPYPAITADESMDVDVDMDTNSHAHGSPSQTRRKRDRDGDDEYAGKKVRYR
ncbi:WD40 repeat-like protein [Macrolepiota fuliginosa MF-IS2]|uniref:WD40 repeat-like protein n=1 Tax=Macrolepiota fuliginosa MF-IS2 TaxID=1400762 RepID=A0A9P5XCG6_9AGAR|nr:WD40 repeat-like protein [Macrolepiota fuliginosa MF-IS2]